MAKEKLVLETIYLLLYLIIMMGIMLIVAGTPLLYNSITSNGNDMPSLTGMCAVMSVINGLMTAVAGYYLVKIMDVVLRKYIEKFWSYEELSKLKWWIIRLMIIMIVLETLGVFLRHVT